MRSSTRRWVVGLVVVALLALGVNGAISLAQSTDDIAKAWAGTLTFQEKVQFGLHIERLRPEYQRAIVLSMPWKQKNAFLAYRIEYFVQAHNLTGERQALLQEAIRSIARYETQEQAEADKSYIHDLNTRIVTAFDPKVIELFMMEGGVFPANRSLDDASVEAAAPVLPVSVRLKQFVSDLIFANASVENCNCLNHCLNGSQYCKPYGEEQCYAVAACLDGPDPIVTNCTGRCVNPPPAN